MKRLTSRWLPCIPAGLLSLGLVASAAELQPTPQEFLIPRASVTVDGDLADWQPTWPWHSIDPSRVRDDLAIIALSNDPANPIKGPADLSARVALAWDEDNLYLAGVVRDDDLRGIKPATAHNVGPPGWECDSVMFQVSSFRHPMRPNSPHTPTPNLVLRYEVPERGRGRLLNNATGALDVMTLYWKLPQGSVLASRETADGYQVEAAVPWRGFGYRPQAGEVLYCSFLLGDIDRAERLNQLGWHFSEVPKERAVFRLLGRPEATGLLSVGADEVAPGEELSVKYRVDARTADVRLRRLVVTGLEGEAATVALGVTVPKGQTATDVVAVGKAPASAGACRARLEVEIGGESVTLCTQDFAVLRGEQTTPLVVNPPGELHHQRPDRVPHSALEDFTRGLVRHGFVTDRSGYERYILTHVKDYVDREMEPTIARESINVIYDVLMAYTLHKLTGEERYADLTRRGLAAAVAAQKRELDHTRLLPLVEARYHIWLRDPNTRLAPPNIETDFRELWATLAQEPDESWLFAEWGYHNRCWHRWAVQRIARLCAQSLGRPVSPRIDEYVAWHDPLLAHFGAATDNSAGYHWVGFRYPVHWHQATDTLAELGKHEGWIAALHRWRRYSSPSGAVPNFGDTSGWGSGADEAMAYYELMGRLTRDGRFRWQAHRIAEYLYNHFWPRHDQYHQPRDRAAAAFCTAWLYADDSVAPVPPETRSGVTFRTRVVEPTPEETAKWPGGGRNFRKLVDEQVPDKLILSSGNDPNALWGLVELIDTANHCGIIPGHITALMQHDAALLVTPAYNEETPELNNLVWIEDLEGIPPQPQPPRADVPKLVEDASLTYARIRVHRFQQLPVTYVRDIVFVKNGFLLVKDRITFHAAMKVRVGPCWQTRDLGPQCGEDWFNTYYEYIYHTGVGLGQGVHAYRNPAWDLLVRFGRRPGASVTVTDRSVDNPWRPSPTRLRQRWSGIAQAGETKTFTTVLLPHGPDFDDTKYADWVELLVDDDDTTLVRVRTEIDNVHHFQDVHWLLLQERPGDMAQQGFRSDAELALVTIDRRGTVRPAVMMGGSVLTLDGQNLSAGARKPRPESVFIVSGGA